MSEDVLLARLAAVAARSADASNAARALARPVVDAFVDAGVYRMLVPQAVGGGEVSPRTFVEVLEAVARGDGSAGWCAMVGATTGLVAALLPTEVARELFPRDVVPCGVFAPLGKATTTGDGLRVSGRWPFASGSTHATVRLGGVIVASDKGPVVRHALMTGTAVRVVDTWATTGLRGTGSHDMTCEDVFVPEAHVVSLFGGTPRYASALYAFPFFGLLSLGIAAVALGIARSALDTFAALAAQKVPAGGKRPLAQRETVQVRYAEAEATLQSARALVHVAVDDAYATALASGAVSTAEKARLRLAAAHAVRASAAVVDVAYHGAGGSSLYESHPLHRLFQDIHVATQHAMVNEPVVALAGRVMLGVETDTSQL